MKTAFFALASASALLFVSDPLSAQRDMYGLGGNTASSARRQFEAEARVAVTSVLADYESAWGSDDPEVLSRLYAGSATLYPAEGGVVTGRAGVRDYFGKLLPKVAPIRTRVVEFKASGDLAFVTVQVTYRVAEGGAENSFLGTDVFVLRKAWVEPWTIVSHYAKPESPAPTAAAPAADAPATAPPAATADSAGARND